jgi:hypothetical protein
VALTRSPPRLGKLGSCFAWSFALSNQNVLSTRRLRAYGYFFLASLSGCGMFQPLEPFWKAKSLPLSSLEARRCVSSCTICCALRGDLLFLQPCKDSRFQVQQSNWRSSID